MTKHQVKDLIQRVTASCLGTTFTFIVDYDKKYISHDGGGRGRVYLQCQYAAPCIHSGDMQSRKGRKWYLSEHMTQDEVIKTAYCAFETAVKHEILEGFRVDDLIIFNPHTPFNALQTVSMTEVKREDPRQQIESLSMLSTKKHIVSDQPSMPNTEIKKALLKALGPFTTLPKLVREKGSFPLTEDEYNELLKSTLDLCVQDSEKLWTLVDSISD